MSPMDWNMGLMAYAICCALAGILLPKEWAWVGLLGLLWPLLALVYIAVLTGLAVTWMSAKVSVRLSRHRRGVTWFPRD